MRQLVCCVCLLIGLAPWVRGQDSDAELEKAKKAFKDAVSKQKELLSAGFERKLTEVTRLGNLSAVEELKTEQAEFQKQGTLPESAIMKSFVEKYSKAVESAQERLKTSFEKRVKALTRAGDIEAAKAAQIELEGLLQGPAPQAKAAVPANAAPNKAAMPKKPAGSRADVSVVRAIWRPDGAFNEPGGIEQLEVTETVANILLGRGNVPISRSDLGTFTNQNASLSLFLELRIFQTAVHLRLSEGSSIVLGSALPSDAQLPGARMGTTPLELIQVLWKADRGDAQADLTQAATEQLQVGPLSIEPPVFEDIAFGIPKQAIFRFRAGSQIMEIRATDRSTLVIPMTVGLNYKVPWQQGADIELDFQVQKAIWRDADGGKAKDVTNVLNKIVAVRAGVACDSATFGPLGPGKSPRSMDLEMQFHGLKIELSLLDGSMFQLVHASKKDLESTNAPLGGSDVYPVEVAYRNLEGNRGMGSSLMIDALRKGEVKIEHPLFEDFVPGPKIAYLRLRAGQRVLKIGAMNGSRFTITP
jgi:hypothetical protein